MVCIVPPYWLALVLRTCVVLVSTASYLGLTKYYLGIWLGLDPEWTRWLGDDGMWYAWNVIIELNGPSGLSS